MLITLDTFPKPSCRKLPPAREVHNIVLDPEEARLKEIRLALPEHEQRYLNLIAELFKEARSRFHRLCKPSQTLKALWFLQTTNINLNIFNAINNALKHGGINYSRSKIQKKVQALSAEVEHEHIRRTASPDVIEELTKLKQEAKKHILLFAESHVVVEDANGDLINPGSIWLEDHLDELKAAGYNTLVMEKPQDLPLDSKRPGSDSLVYSSDEEYIKMVIELRDLLLKKFGYATADDDEVRKFFETLGEYIAQRNLAIKEKRVVKRIVSNPNNKDQTRSRWKRLIDKAKDQGFKVIFVDSTMKLRERFSIAGGIKATMLNKDSKSQTIQDIKHYLTQKDALYMKMRDHSISSRIKAAYEDNESTGVIGVFGANHIANYPVHGYRTAYQRLKEQELPVTTVRLEFEGIKEDTQKTYLTGRNINNGRPKIMQVKDNPLLYNRRFSSQLKISRNSTGSLKTKWLKSPRAQDNPHFDAVMYFPYKPAAA